MDSLMAAVVAALLIRTTDPSTDLVAIAAGRRPGPGLVILGALVALAVTQGVAAAGGWLVAPHLTPNAARLLFAFSLLMAGGGAFRRGRPAAVSDARPPVIDVTARLIAAGLGDRTMFATFAVAAGGVPALAGVGGAIGGMVVLAGAAIAGDTLWCERPRRSIDAAIGTLLLVTGAWLAVSALRLI